MVREKSEIALKSSKRPEKCRRPSYIGVFPASGVGGPTESDKSSGPWLLLSCCGPAAGFGLTLDPNLYLALCVFEAAFKVVVQGLALWWCSTRRPPSGGFRPLVHVLQHGN